MPIQARLIQYSALHSEGLSLMARLDEIECGDYVAEPSELDSIERRIAKNLKEMERLRELIDGLGDPLEREVLRLRYIDSTDCKPVKWKAVASKMFSGSTETKLQRVYRLHRSALSHLEDGVAENRQQGHA